MQIRSNNFLKKRNISSIINTMDTNNLENFILPETLKDFSIHFVGIKGTGMAALAELLQNRGAKIHGSDTEEKFYTDEILQELGIPYKEGFSKDNIPADTELVIYSAAYSIQNNPELQEADARKITCIEYTDALGVVSKLSDSTGIAGVHGKTTTTGITGTILKHLKLPVSILVGSAVGAFGNRSTYVYGDSYFVAETCEYRRHFLSFNPSRIVLTSIEEDHQDYYTSHEDIENAFVEYIQKLPQGGELIYCADDPGAFEAAQRVKAERPDIVQIPYGTKAEGDYKITGSHIEDGASYFSLQGFKKPFAIGVPGWHVVLDSVAAIAVSCLLLKKEYGEVTPRHVEDIAHGLTLFTGSKRRSEILGEAGKVLIMDDYGHHPTAVKTTLEGLKEFYPGRRLVVDFMSHTYSRTEALLHEFADSFDAADMVILHKIYASAREKYNGQITGEDLFEETKRRHPNVHYFHEVHDALDFCLDNLMEGDLFITMGAGDNWTLGKEIFRLLKKGES